LRPLGGRDNVCVAAAGGKTPDVSSERRTFADVMTENKLRATQVSESALNLSLFYGSQSHLSTHPPPTFLVISQMILGYLVPRLFSPSCSEEKLWG